MFKQIWHKIQSYGRFSKGESLREASKSLDVPKSTIWHQEKRNEERSAEMGTDYWNTAKGQYDLKRMIISVIYTFGIKGGAGAGRIAEHFNHLNFGSVAALSQSSIRRMIKELEASILGYKALQEAGLKADAAVALQELEAVLGLDETWLDEMLLVCQELSSGYLFLKKQAKNETAKAGGH